MPGDEDDDVYFDDDLDELPPNTFQQLQQDAIRSTQQVANDSRQDLPIPKQAPAFGFGTGPIHAAQSLANRYDNPHRPSSDYGDFEEDDMLDGEVYDAAQDPPVNITQGNYFGQRASGEATQREIWRQQRFSEPQAVANLTRPLDHGTTQQPLPRTRQDKRGPIEDEDEDEDEDAMAWSPEKRDDGQGRRATPSVSVDALQAQIEGLLQERDSLRKETEEAKARALAKTGEIAIVRAKQSKAEKEFEQKLASLQKSHADEAARQKLEVQNARAEKQKIATEKGFLEHDLAQQKTSRAVVRKSSAHGPATTPKKNRVAPFADGFEEEEVRVVTPSKLTFRTKPTTPKAGAKRKRKVPEASPAKPLELSQSRNASFVEDDIPQPLEGEEINEETGNAERAQPKDLKVMVLQEILNYCHYDETRMIESLADFAFPSKADLKLSNLVLDKVTMANDALSIGQALLAIWQQCLDERCFEPLEMIMNVTLRLLYFFLLDFTSDLTDIIVPLTQFTADINLIPRFKKKSASELNPHVSTVDCFQVLHTVAHNLMFDAPEIERFWRCMRFDFVGMMMKPTQPITELLQALSLLKTSILPNSFSMIIPPDDGDQQCSEQVVLDLLSRLLIEMPWVPEDEEPDPSPDVCTLRLEVLEVLSGMLSNPYCSKVLVTSPLVVPRIIRFLCDEIDDLYDYTTDEMNIMRSRGVNIGFMIWHDVCKQLGSEKQQELQEKLKETSGMIGKQLLVLTRLAFCEGGYYEGRIEEVVSELAHEMLEEVLTMEEGEELEKCMGSGRR